MAPPAVAELDYPRAKSQRQVSRAICAHLAARVALAGPAVAAAA